MNFFKKISLSLPLTAMLLSSSLPAAKTDQDKRLAKGKTQAGELKREVPKDMMRAARKARRVIVAEQKKNNGIISVADGQGGNLNLRLQRIDRKATVKVSEGVYQIFARFLGPDKKPYRVSFQVTGQPDKKSKWALSGPLTLVASLPTKP